MSGALFSAMLAALPIVALAAYAFGWWWRGRHDRPTATPETRKWVRDNLATARRVMHASVETGDLRANFAAHDAHRALSDLERCI